MIQSKTSEADIQRMEAELAKLRKEAELYRRFGYTVAAGRLDTRADRLTNQLQRAYREPR